MKKRIFSGFLALAVCLSLCSSAFASFLLLGVKDDVADRGWEFMSAQKAAMTDEQLARLSDAWDNYQNDPDVKAEIEKTANDMAVQLITDELLDYGLNDADGQLQQLYQWKVMRDIFDERSSFAIDSTEYDEWLADFTEFEADNDADISASAPRAALSQLGKYSEDLEDYLERLAEIYFEVGYDDPSLITGDTEDVDKVDLYLRAAVTAAGETAKLDDVNKAPVYTTDTDFLEALTADCVEVMKDLLLNLFDMEMQVSTFRTESAILEELTDRNMKGSLLLIGEAFAEKVINASSEIQSNLTDLDKGALMEELIGGGAASVLSPNNAMAAEKLYDTVNAMMAYILVDVAPDLVDEAATIFGQTVDALETYIDYVHYAMGIVDTDHAVELIHVNTYIGRALLDPAIESSFTVEAGTTYVIDTKLTHDRYEAVANVLADYYARGYNFAEIDVKGTDDLYDEESDISLVSIGENIGEIVVDATALTAGQSGMIEIYRGDSEGGIGTADELDVLRYMGKYSVSIVSESEPLSIELETIDDIELGGTYTIKTTADSVLPEYVTVAVTQTTAAGDSETIYAVVHAAADVESGITLELPENAVIGDVYTVVVGTTDVSASTTFTVVGETPTEEPTEEPTEAPTTETLFIELEEIADLELGSTFTIQTTADSVLPDYVTVAVTKTTTAGDSETVYAVVHAAADLESGITLELPEDAAIGDVYTVVVGTSDVSAATTFTVIGETPTEPYIELEAIDDIVITADDTSFTIKTTADSVVPDYVMVAVTQTAADGTVKTIYAVVHAAADVESGITLELPEDAAVGDVYTVVVGTSDASGVTTFKVVETAAVEYVIYLEEIDDIELGNTYTIKTTADSVLPEYVTVAVTRTTADGESETIYAVVHSAEDVANGITLELPEDAAIGDVYTVVVGTSEASAATTFTVIGETPAEPYIELEAIADIVITADDTSFTIKTTADSVVPDYVMVAVTQTASDGTVKTIYAVVHSAADVANGITLELPEDAALGDVYTVVVGTSDVSGVTTFRVVGSAITIVTAPDSIGEGETLTIVGEVTNVENVHVVIYNNEDPDNPVYDNVITAEQFKDGYPIDTSGWPAGEYTLVVSDVADTTVYDEHTFTITAATTYNPVLSGLDSMSVTRNKTKLYTGTGQEIPDNATSVTFTATIEDETYATIDSITWDDTNHVYVTVKGVKKGTTTMTITMNVVIDGVNYPVTKTVKVSVTSGGGSGGGGVQSEETSDSITITVGGDGEYEAEVSSTQKITWTVTDESIAVLTSDPSDPNATFEGVSEGTTTAVGVITNASGTVVETITLTIEVKAHECEWPDIVGHWAHLTIDTMTINGYINGYPDGLFRPDDNITRAEFSAIVYRILGLTVASDGIEYDDTPGHWAEDIIATMSLPEGYGMLRGYGDGNFGPNDAITREQAVAIIARAKSAIWEAAEDGARETFTDSDDISWWFDGEIDSAVTNGLITGYEDGSFKPLNNITRAEAAVMLSRAWPEVLD